MTLTPEAVEAYKTLMTNPKDNGLDFPALSEVFEESETAIAKHIVFKKYLDIIQKPLPKVFFYIIMDELYKQAKAEDGNLGYCVKINSQFES